MNERFPFAELATRDVRRENWLSIPRHGVTFALGEAHAPSTADGAQSRTVSFEPCPVHAARVHTGHAILVRAVIDGHDAEIFCDAATVQEVTRQAFGTVDQSLLASRERALVIEHVAGDILAMLERQFGCQVTFHWASPDVEPDLPSVGAVQIRLDGRPRPGFAVLHGGAPVAEMFHEWVESCALRPLESHQLMIDVSLLFGATTLAMAELRDLSVGDTVLIDDKFPVDRPLRAIAGKKLVADARFSGAQIEAVSRFSALRGGQTFRWMTEPLEGVQLDMNDSANIATNQLGDMKVRLVFEVGRAELSVSEIERLGPGHVFQVSRASDGHVDVIAGGRVIGSGELVKIGEDIGVRLKRIAS